MLRQFNILLLTCVWLLWISPTLHGFQSESKRDPFEELRAFLELPADQRPPLEEQAFAQLNLPPAAISEATRLLWEDRQRQIRESRQTEMEARVIKWESREMPFWYQVYGDAPPDGRSLFISLHGGGNGPARMNDRQWENQKQLYRPAEGVYVAPRAPTNTWNLWHEAHIDPMFDRLIENMIVFEGVNPDRVYLLGYSAGGDGVYQLAPRMADRFAAAAMMAGHPNEASPWGLRNLPFAIHMGENDSAYRRNEVAREWGTRLQELRADDPDGYEHLVKLHAGKGHWMDRQDAEAITWLAAKTRRTFPDRIVWFQDDVLHTRFYWLSLDPAEIRPGLKVIARRTDQHIQVDSPELMRITIRFHPEMIDFERPVTINFNGEQVFAGRLQPTIATLANTLRERGDKYSMYPAEITVQRTPK